MRLPLRIYLDMICLCRLCPSVVDPLFHHCALARYIMASNPMRGMVVSAAILCQQNGLRVTIPNMRSVVLGESEREHQHRRPVLQTGGAHAALGKHARRGAERLTARSRRAAVTRYCRTRSGLWRERAAQVLFTPQ